MAKKPKHAEAIFDFNENVSQLLTDAATFYAAIAPAGAITPTSPAGAGAAYVTIPVAQITTALAHITATRTAENTASTRAKGTADARNLALAAVITDIHNFVGLVQTQVTNAASETLAKTIVTACGLHTRKIATPKTKPPFDVKNDPAIAGDVDFIFKAAGRGIKAHYEIQQSTDNANWLTVKTTGNARSKFAHGMTSGTKLYFRGRMVLSEKQGGAQEWQIPPKAFLYVL